jgi:hypothetical protein
MQQISHYNRAILGVGYRRTSFDPSKADWTAEVGEAEE